MMIALHGRYRCCICIQPIRFIKIVFLLANNCHVVFVLQRREYTGDAAACNCHHHSKPINITKSIAEVNGLGDGLGESAFM